VTVPDDDRKRKGRFIIPAPREVLDLASRFEENLAAYASGAYNEAQLRREFIDPLFRALGWDLDNVVGHAEAYKDVIHEDAIRIGGAVKAPDYCFRIGGTRKFFVEAKKPAVRIAEEAAPAYQLRRYAWSAGLSSPSSRISKNLPFMTAASSRTRTTGPRRPGFCSSASGTTPPAGRRSPPSSPRRPSSGGPSTATPNRPA
jgi:hypothetical protein